MPQAFHWSDMSPEARSLAERGAENFRDLLTVGRDRQMWKATAIGLGCIRAEALRLNGLNSDQIQHPLYRKTFRALLLEPEAGDLNWFRERGHRAVMQHCLWWSQHIDAVDAWIANLSAKERLLYNHPTTIWRKHPDGQPASRPSAEEDRNTMIDPDTGEEIRLARPSRDEQERRHLQFITEENIRLRQRLDQLERGERRAEAAVWQAPLDGDSDDEPAFLLDVRAIIVERIEEISLDWRSYSADDRVLLLSGIDATQSLLDDLKRTIEHGAEAPAETAV